MATHRGADEAEAVSAADLLGPDWTPIAARSRNPNSGKLLTWHPLHDAPITLLQARELSATGVIVMANRHFPNRVELVVRTPVHRA